LRLHPNGKKEKEAEKWKVYFHSLKI